VVRFIIGVDIGGTQLRACLADASGKIYKRLLTETRSEDGRTAVLQRLLDLITNLMAETPLDEVAAIGIGAPGPLNPFTGYVVEAPNLAGWVNVPLKDLVAEQFGLPTYLGNDANVAALAEYRFGAGKGARNLIYITVSTGIGGGVIVDGHMLLGEKGFAAEIGHITLEANGPRCNCGNIGCWEAFSSGTAIGQEAIRRLEAGEDSSLRARSAGDYSRISARWVAEAALEGDLLAQSVFQRAGFYMGVGLVNLLHLFNPSVITIGGSVMKAGDLIWQPLWKTLRERVEPFYLEDVRIVPAALGDDVGLLGAIALVLEEGGGETLG